MSCPKHIKKFLWIKFEGEHDFKPTYVRRSLFTGVFWVDVECIHCKSKDEYSVKTEWLIRKGLCAEKLSDIFPSDVFGKNFDELKED